jgi:hypothetical protein
MIISFIEEVQYTRRPINVHVLFSPEKPEKLQKSRGAARKIPAKLPEKPSELQ